MRMLLVSFVLIVAGAILMILAQSGLTSSGAIILIGPVPIILGSGPDSGLLVILGLVMTVLMVIFFLFANRRRW